MICGLSVILSVVEESLPLLYSAVLCQESRSFDYAQDDG